MAKKVDTSIMDSAPATKSRMRTQEFINRISSAIDVAYDPGRPTDEMLEITPHEAVMIALQRSKERADERTNRELYGG